MPILLTISFGSSKETFMKSIQLVLWKFFWQFFGNYFGFKSNWEYLTFQILSEKILKEMLKKSQRIWRKNSQRKCRQNLRIFFFWEFFRISGLMYVQRTCQKSWLWHFRKRLKRRNWRIFQMNCQMYS